MIGPHDVEADVRATMKYFGVKDSPSAPGLIADTILAEDKSPGSILHEAYELIHGQRAKDYGHPKVNFQRIADLWNAYLRYSTTDEITPQDTAVMMLLLKIARLQQSPHNRDSLVDLAGYAGTIERLWEE